MKKVYDTIGILGVVMLFVAAAFSDSGAISFGKIIALGAIAVVLILVSLNGVDANEYVEIEETPEIVMVRNEQYLQKSAS